MRSKKSIKCSIATIVTTLTILLSMGLVTANGSAYAASASLQAAQPTTTADLYNDVDPFTGTGVQQGAVYGGGDTFPGADAPFGMVQWSPDTVKLASGGYDYTDNQIKGFSLTHLSGAGCTAYGDIPFMPYVGSVTNSPATDPTQYVSSFSHADESANAGYYQVKLGNGVNTELTALQRSGEGRFTYPAGQTATMLVNVSGSATGTADAQATISKDTISGYATSGSFCGATNAYRVYFWAKFSQPFASTGTWHNGAVSAGAVTAKGNSTVAPAVKQVIAAQTDVKAGNATSAQTKAAQAHPDTTVSGPGSGAYVTFNTSKTTAISVNVGLSFVSVDNAQANSQSDASGVNFDTSLTNAHKLWDTSLGAIKVGGGTDTQTTTFYTALYHSLLQPNIFSDSNGQYIGFDGQVHKTAAGHVQYANYSGWDIYRSEIQLLALLAPKETSDIVQSMVNDYAQGGLLPKWSQANGESYVMVGDPSDPIISSAYAFGATGFDTKAALAAMIKEATQANDNRPGLNYLQTLGYEPANGSYGCCNFYGAASTTLEDNTADFSIGAFAQALGDTANYQKFTARAQDWENLFNPSTGYLEPRNTDGSFPSVFNPASQDNWVEGNGAQYNWMVPFNLSGLFDAFGGTAKATQRLDTFFTQLNAGPDLPYGFLGNEPTLETPWEYDYLGAPYKTQQIVRQVENTIYAPGPGGLAGNDDLGEMSSWYVFAALGLFPETPGTADLALGSPLFSSITLKRESGQTIKINAPQASTTTPYVQSLKVNGQASTKPWLPASFVASGGTLDYTLSDTANTSWGSSTTDAPPSYQYGSTSTFVSLNPGRPTVAPGSSSSVTVNAQNISDSASTVQWTATAPAGLTITPDSGSITIPAGSTANQSFAVAADANTTEGVYQVAFSAKTADGTTLPMSGFTTVVAKPGNLLGVFNNAGISDDANPGGANVDSDGFSYSAQALAAVGFTPGATVSVNGVNYTWPSVPVATYDNVEAAGQVLQLPDAKAGATSLNFLGCATNGPSTGTVTITYTDGSTQTAQLGFSDWTLGGGSTPQPSFDNVIAAKTNYRDSSGGAQQVATYIFATAPIALDGSKQVASVTLPTSANQGSLHIFALTVS
jgi:predicted alpha-1,2-mannosidase